MNLYNNHRTPKYNDNVNILNEKILNSILDDDDELFSNLISQINVKDSTPSQQFQLTNYKLPEILSFSPTYACLCAFFSAEKCFQALAMMTPEGLDSETFKKRDKMGRSLIHFACAGGSMSIIRELEQANYDLNDADSSRKTPSHYSAMFGTIDVLKYLWTKGADILQMKSFAVKPIHEACKFGNLEIVKFICENVDKSALSSNVRIRETPLHLACENGHFDIVKYILSYEEVAKKLINESDYHSRTPLVCACQNGSLECVKALVQFGNVQFISKHRKHSALIDAAANGHADIVQYLIKQKECDIAAKNCQKLTGIEAAILNGHIDVVDVLVQNGAVKNYTKNQIGDLFLAACGTFNNEMIEFLDKTFEIPYQTMGDIFMSQAVKIESKSLICFLLNKGCELNDKTCSVINFRAKWTPFMSFLKSKGADFSHLVLKSDTPLIVQSAREGSLSSVQKLISEGVVLNKEIISKHNLLNSVVYMGKADLFDFLVSFEPEMSDVDSSFRSLLGRIHDNLQYRDSKYYKGCLHIAETLLKDFKVNPNDSKTVNYAFKYSLVDVLELLLKYGCNFSNIHISCEYWNIDYDFKFLDENIKFLQRNNFDINNIYSTNLSPIIVEGFKTGRTKVVNDLLSKGFELKSEFITKYDLVNDVCNSGSIELFDLLMAFKPVINDTIGCLLKLFICYLGDQKNDKIKQNCLKMADTLFTEYNIDPNDEILLNFLVITKLVDVLEFITKFNVDFNCCYFDYSQLATKDSLNVLLLMEKHGCLFQKAKYSHLNIYSVAYSRKKKDLYENEKDEITCAVQLNLKAADHLNYDVNTLLILINHSTNDDIINSVSDNINVIDVLLRDHCYYEIINVFDKLGRVLLPKSCSIDKFKDLIIENVNIENLPDKIKLIMNPFING